MVAASCIVLDIDLVRRYVLLGFRLDRLRESSGAQRWLLDAVAQRIYDPGVGLQGGDDRDRFCRSPTLSFPTSCRPAPGNEEAAISAGYCCLFHCAIEMGKVPPLAGRRRSAGVCCLHRPG